MGKGGGTTETTQEPWGGQQPYLRRGFEEAWRNFQSGGPEFYPGATYVPFSGQTEQGLGMMQDRAMAGLGMNPTGSGGAGGSNMYSGANVERGMQDRVLQGLNEGIGGGFQQNYLQNQMQQDPRYFGGTHLGGYGGRNLNQTLRGDYLNANPYMDAMYGHAAGQVTDQFQNAVMPGINATFGGAGRTGSGLHGQVVGDAAGELGESLQGMAANLYGGNYQQERGRQMQAINQAMQDDLSRRGMNQQGYQFQQGLGQSGSQILNQLGMMDQQAQQGWANMAPTAAGFDYNNINNLLGVGGATEGKGREMLQDSMNRFNYYQGRPEDNLARYMASIMGNYGGVTTQSGPGGNPWATVLGGIGTVAGAGNQFGWWGQ